MTIKAILFQTSTLSDNYIYSLPTGNCGVKYFYGLEFEQIITFCNGLSICLHKANFM